MSMLVSENFMASVGELVGLLDKFYDTAEKEGLYVGMGYNAKLSRREQEGPVVLRIKELKEIIKKDKNNDKRLTKTQ